jgi:hypothetical protein
VISCSPTEDQVCVVAASVPMRSCFGVTLQSLRVEPALLAIQKARLDSAKKLLGGPT